MKSAFYSDIYIKRFFLHNAQNLFIKMEGTKGGTKNFKFEVGKNRGSQIFFKNPIGGQMLTQVQSIFSQKTKDIIYNSLH